MTRRFHMGLRDNQHMVTLMKVNGQSREVLGRAYPNDENRRQRILDNWGLSVQSPRIPEPASIDIPLSPRAQTILSYEMAPAVRDQLNGGLPPQTQSRKDEQNGVKDRIHRGPNRPILPVESRPGRDTAKATQNRFNPGSRPLTPKPKV